MAARSLQGGEMVPNELLSFPLSLEVRDVFVVNFSGALFELLLTLRLFKRLLHPPDFPQHEQIKAFHLLPGPRSLAKKLQAGADAGVEREAANGNSPRKFVPPVMSLEGADHRFQGDAVKGVARLL